MAKQRITVNVKNQRKMKKKPSSPTAIGKLIRAVGSAGGGYLGGMVGAPTLGGAAGHQLGAMASKWLGFGDYTVSRNSIMTKAADGIPTMHKEDQGIVLRHKEFVGTIVSSQDFSVQYALPLNPGMTSFPWLSKIAARFQQYKFRGVVFHYVPASGAAISGTNSSLGTVMLQTTYRATDSAPTSKIEMLNEYWANEVVPSDSAIHPIECAPKQNPFNVQYVRSVAVPSGESQLSYDLGKTFIATQGQQVDGAYLGDLWVTYEVELTKPVYSSNITVNPVSTTTFSGSSASSLFNTITTTNDTIGISFSNNSITFPSNTGTRFCITAYWNASVVSACVWNGVTVTNGMNYDIVGTQVASGAAQIMVNGLFTKIDVGKTSVVTITPPTLTGTINLVTVRVYRID